MTPPRKKNRLHKISLKELSLVDSGANQRADVVFSKRAPQPVMFAKVFRMLTSTPD